MRVKDPESFLSTIPGVRTISRIKTADLSVALPQEEKVFIWQRMILSFPEDLGKLKELLKRDYLIVAEIDDYPERRPEYAANQFLSYRGVHCVQTSTEPLADYLRQHNPNVAVFPNHIAYLPPPRTYQEQQQQVNIFFGALNREQDWQPIIEIINRVLADYDRKKIKVGVKVIHDRQFFQSLDIPPENKEFTDFCPYEQYLRILGSCDLGILPLIPNSVNSMKSD